MEDFAVFTDGRLALMTGDFLPHGAFCVDRFVLSENVSSTNRGAIVCAPMQWSGPANVKTEPFDGSTVYPKCCKDGEVGEPF
jgi:hypothetical protein